MQAVDWASDQPSEESTQMANPKLPSRTAPEQWRLVPSNPDYNISDHGNVQRATPGRNTAPGRPLTSHLTWHGYPYVTLCWPGMVRKAVTVHRLVAQAFIPNETNLPFVNHRNFIRDDNHVSNLEWCTQRENVVHAHANGRFPKVDRRGERNNNSKLVADQVLAIRALHERNTPMLTLAVMFEVSKAQIWEICTRRVWTHI